MQEAKLRGFHVARMNWHSCILLAILVLMASSPTLAKGKKTAKPNASLNKVTLEVSTISGARPPRVRLDVVIQYGEATVVYAENLGEGSAFEAGQSATFNLPVDYDLPSEYAERGPELCLIAKSFTGSERWQFKARIDLIYSDGKTVSYTADTLRLDAETQSTCKDFWHD